MRPILAVLTALALAQSWIAETAAAQEAEPVVSGGRFYVSLGAGGGSADFTCDRCRFTMSPGLSGYAMLGGRVATRTVLGIEATGWTKRDTETTGRMFGVMGTALGYFDDGLPLFLSAGAGLMHYRRTMPTGTATASAPGFSLRLGAELRLAGSLRLVPYVGFLRTLREPEFKLSDGGAYGIAAGFNNLQFGTAITIH